MKKIITLILSMAIFASCNIPVYVNDYTGSTHTLERKSMSVYKIKQIDNSYAKYYIHGYFTGGGETHIELEDTIGRYQVGDKLDFIKISE